MAISLFHLVRTETEQMMTAMLNVLEHAEGLVEAGKIEEDALMGELVNGTLTLMRSISEDELEGAEDKTVEITARGQPTRFKGQDYLLRFAIPQMGFHVTTAYCLVRKAGAELGKRHYFCDIFDYTLA